MAGLFDPAEIGNLKLKNRFVRSATAECMADSEGHVTTRLINLYARLASAGVGLLITGGAYVHPGGRSYVGVIGAHDDSVIEGFLHLTEAVHERDSRIVLQLYHCGRQGEREAAGGSLVGPSAAADRLVRTTPKALSAREIESMVAAFGEAAGRAKAGGFDGVQILAANGYLVNQFLSPYANHRKDEWGGILANRMRFLLEIYRSVRTAVGPEFPVLVKLTMADFVRGGLTPEEALIVAESLAKAGVDAIEVTGGTLESFFQMSRGDIPIEEVMGTKIMLASNGLIRQMVRVVAAWMEGRVRFEEAYFAQYAEMIRRATGIPIMLVGGLRSPLVMDQLIREGKTDFVCLSRPLLREPQFVRRVAEGDWRPSLCSSCNKCLVSVTDGRGVRCFGGRPTRKARRETTTGPGDQAA